MITEPDMSALVRVFNPLSSLLISPPGPFLTQWPQDQIFTLAIKNPFLFQFCSLGLSLPTSKLLPQPPPPEGFSSLMVWRCGKEKNPIQKHHPVGQRTTLLDTLIFGSKLGNSVLEFNYVTAWL